MITIFKIHDHRGQLLKVNYVDDKNRFAGFDLRHQCCESTDHWIETNDGIRIEPDWRGQFDHLQFTDDEPIECGDADHCDQFVVFYLIDTLTGGKYKLIFENCHNGWYSHHYEYGEIKKIESSI